MSAQVQEETSHGHGQQQEKGDTSGEEENSIIFAYSFSVCTLAWGSTHILHVVLSLCIVDHREEAGGGEGQDKNSPLFPRGELLTTLVNHYKGLSSPDFVQMSQCLIFLDEPLALADVLKKLSNGNDAPIPITKVQQNDETYVLSRGHENLHGV